MGWVNGVEWGRGEDRGRPFLTARKPGREGDICGENIRMGIRRSR